MKNSLIFLLVIGLGILKIYGESELMPCNFKQLESNQG